MMRKDAIRNSRRFQIGQGRKVDLSARMQPFKAQPFINTTSNGLDQHLRIRYLSSSGTFSSPMPRGWGDPYKAQWHFWAAPLKHEGLTVLVLSLKEYEYVFVNLQPH